jgi:hypothetical protein
MRTKTLFALALAFVTLAGPVHAGSKTRIKGKGIFGNGQRFRFVFTNESGGAGPVEFDAGLLGTVTGVIDCLDFDGTLAMMSGQIDTPTGGYTHYLLVAEDGKATRSPDRIAIGLRDSSFDCALDGDDADLADDRQPIERGNIVVRTPLP